MVYEGFSTSDGFRNSLEALEPSSGAQGGPCVVIGLTFVP